MAGLAELAAFGAGDDDGEVGELGAGGPSVRFRGQQEVLDGEEGAGDVCGVGFLPEGERQLPDRVGVRFVGYPGVGDEDVDGAEVLEGVGEAGLD